MTDRYLEQLLIIVDRAERGVMLPAEAARLRTQIQAPVRADPPQQGASSMSMSVTELAALPAAPTISRALREAAGYSDHGPHLALRRAMFGSITFEDFVAVITPEHAIAEGVALILVGGLVDPEVTDQGWPDASWPAGFFCERVRHAHQALAGWAETHSDQQLAHLFEAAADRAQMLETA